MVRTDVPVGGWGPVGGTPEDVVTGVWTGAYVEGCVTGHHRGVEDQQNEIRSPAGDAAGQCLRRRDTGGE